ncbi:hypothetical protein FOA52_007860, partial [Chlamydomonas sp. UWO 241]
MAAADMAATCAKVLQSIADLWRAHLLRRMQNYTIDWRLGDGSRTGKIVARNSVLTQLQSWIVANSSELFAPVFQAPYGTAATGSGALTARLDVLQKYYVRSPVFYTGNMPASDAIKRSTVYDDPAVTGFSIAALAVTRLNELWTLRNSTLADVPIPPPTANYPTKTLGQIVAQFEAAGAGSSLG